MVDHIIEIPLANRTLHARFDGPHRDVPGVHLPAFIAGPENRLIAATFDHLVARSALPKSAVSNVRLGTGLPAVLALFGPSGTGKTHLCRGLVRHWQQFRGDESAEYVIAHDFRRQLMDAMDGNAIEEFRRRLRSRELLAIDDLHRLPADEYLLHELRFTLDAIEESGGAVLVTSHRPVSSLGNLTPDLRSRLVAGLMLQLAAPGKAARARIVQHVATSLHCPLTEQQISELAAGLRGTANQLIGALYELYADLPTGASADLDQTRRRIADRVARRPSLPEVIKVVAKYYGLPQRYLKSGSRKQTVVQGRATIAYLARELTGVSYQQIGRALGGRDHTTIMHNYRNIDRARQRDLALQEALDELRRILLSC